MRSDQSNGLSELVRKILIIGIEQVDEAALNAGIVAFPRLRTECPAKAPVIAVGTIAFGKREQASGKDGILERFIRYSAEQPADAGKHPRRVRCETPPQVSQRRQIGMLWVCEVFKV